MCVLSLNVSLFKSVVTPISQMSEAEPLDFAPSEDQLVAEPEEEPEVICRYLIFYIPTTLGLCMA